MIKVHEATVGASMATAISRSRSFRFALADLLGLIALTAIGCRWPALIIAVISIAAYRLTRAIAIVSREAIALVLASVYLPCVIGFFSDCTHCRGVWMNLWGVLPGGVAWMGIVVLLGLPRSSDVVSFSGAAILTLAYIVCAVLVASRGRRFLAGVTLACFGLSSIAAFFAYVAIRS
jgi:hypothetical protein